MTQTEFHHAKPVYEYFDGLEGGHLRLPHLRRPAGQRAGLRAALEEMSGAPIWGVGVGPGREQTLTVHD